MSDLELIDSRVMIQVLVRASLRLNLLIFILSFSGSNPVQIASPPELEGMSLETRLTSYDWDTNFETFQRVTQKGSFKSMCLNAKGAELPVS